jgi:DNA (cytosine-5)-methyltransferase 1
MVARLQGWRDEWEWRFTGLKTARYRQIGNAFPPPVAAAVGAAIRAALAHSGPPAEAAEMPDDPVFRALRSRTTFLTVAQIADRAAMPPGEVLRQLRHLSQDFDLEAAEMPDGAGYRLGSFKAFLGQRDHSRHERFAAGRSTIS